MKKLFGYVVDGAVLGVENNGSKLANAFATMAETAAREINKLINDDYPDDYNPVFTPVFDLSGIEKDTRRLNNILSIEGEAARVEIPSRRRLRCVLLAILTRNKNKIGARWLMIQR